MNWGSPYIGFNDTRFTLVGILVIFLLVPPLFTEYTYWEYHLIPGNKFLISFLMTISIWIYSRAALICSRKVYSNDTDYLKRILVVVMSVLCGTFLIQALVVAGLKMISQITALKLIEHQSNGSIVITYFIAFGVLAIYESIYYFNKYIESVHQKKELEKAHVISQLQHLQQQLNPHFLFNSLNTLMSLIPMNPDRAMSYLGKLSLFYRYAVSNQESFLIPLKEELEHVRLYVDLLKERFGDSFFVRIGEDATDGIFVFPMSLQLLIENAIKHNALGKGTPLVVEIFVSDDVESIVIENNRQARNEEVSSTGKGLQNLRERYSFYNGNTIDVEMTENTFRVRLPIIEQI